MMSNILLTIYIEIAIYSYYNIYDILYKYLNTRKA